MQFLRRLFLVPGIACLALLSACGDIPEQRARVEVRAAEVTPTTVDRVAVRKLRAQIVWQDTILFNAVLALHAAAELNAVAVKEAQVRAEQGAPLRPPATAPPLVMNAGSCWDMVAQYFADDLAWAQRTTQPESGCTYAINYEGCDLSGQTDSHALGPGQICLPLHARQFEAVGCSWTQWRDPGCYFRAWRHLYDEQGRGPWGG